jgi:hypothetical protein
MIVSEMFIVLVYGKGEKKKSESKTIPVNRPLRPIGL